MYSDGVTTTLSALHVDDFHPADAALMDEADVEEVHGGEYDAGVEVEDDEVIAGGGGGGAEEEEEEDTYDAVDNNELATRNLFEICPAN
jgi:hypothetical protein